uniref:Bifunctional inhibitor/plant lipid transfer protein/seed storage helical domain-containing protein n=1 Tax=Kalanchoe fedtschenkoi TaxID=63787 RepID=A0A7N0RD75_KALFE
MAAKSDIHIKSSAALMVLVAVLAATAHRTAAFGCHDMQIMGEIEACKPYLTGQSDKPPSPKCCQQAKGLSDRASATEGHNQWAYCISIRACSNNYGFQGDRAEGLPVLCGYNASMPLSGLGDCAK